VTGTQIANSLSALAVGFSIQLAENNNWNLVAYTNKFRHGFAVKLELRGGGSYSLAGYLSNELKPTVDELIYNAEAYIQDVFLKTLVYTPPKYPTKDAEITALRNALTLIKSLSTPPKYPTKDAEITALRNALTLIKSLSTPPNSLPWESSTQPHLPTLVDKISTIAKEVL
jgi:hypothetical protein